jgi:hypothetical protein
MVSLIMTIVIVLCIGGIVWMRRRRQQADALPVSLGGIPPKTLALKAFAHGNSCLAEGKFAEANAAFHEALELDPKHPHIAGRLAEVERQQQAAKTTPIVNATV